jgi:D-methionine transport system permease protein
MLENILPLIPDIVAALGETFLMLSIAVSAALVLGSPLGVLLFLTGRGQMWEQRCVFRVLNALVNVVRSFPFVILLVALVPFTRLIACTTIGPLAAAVPLSFAAIPYFARLVEQSLREVPQGVLEAAEAMGVTPLQLVWKVLGVEARSGLALAVTVLAVSFLSYSAMAGIVGGGGIGDLAIRFGYYRFQTDVMVVTVVILVIIVQSLQALGNAIARRLDKR